MKTPELSRVEKFESYTHFLNREDKSINGYSEGNPVSRLENSTGCWNCNRCVNCNDCVESTYCFNCTDCVDCWNGSNCHNIENVSNGINMKGTK